MVKVNKPISNTPEVTETQPATKLGGEKAMKLVAEMLAGHIVDIRPQLDFTGELGFTYPAVEQTLKVKGKEAVAIMESLTAKGILNRSFFDRLL